MPEFIKVAESNEIAPGQGKIVEVNGNQIAIWNINGQFHAFQNICPHRGGPVGEGELEGTVITCPWHGWQFDVISCESPINPAAKLTRYELRVEGNEIRIAM